MTMNEDHNKVLEHAQAIGELIRNNFPGTPIMPQREGRGPEYLPNAHIRPIADEITSVVAEILQAYLDAGSERDVTFEELGGEIEAHVRGWGGPE